ncbi:MAG TPA: hypothetical protein DDZ66_02260 [Firmicutes bacterium]|jgi:hypothetical protein|nr:hypothetical protein [Bacillota bacterium]
MKGVETVKIDEMQAGREMDALIAEKVMGWSHKEGLKYDYNGPCEWNMVLIPPTMSDEDYTYWVFPPKGVISKTFFLDKRYSTDIVAAWEVRAKIQELGFTAVNVTAAGEQPYCQFVKPIDEDSIEEHIAYADKDPLAICRASLKAILGSDEV